VRVLLEAGLPRVLGCKGVSDVRGSSTIDRVSEDPTGYQQLAALGAIRHGVPSATGDRRVPRSIARRVL